MYAYLVADKLVSVSTDSSAQLVNLEPTPGTIVIPDGVREIDEFLYAFEDSDAHSLVLPDTLEIIGSYAFENKEQLRSVRLPEGLTRLGNNAFGGCHALEEISLPRSLTGLPGDVFYDCPALQRVIIPADHPTLTYRDGLILSRDGSELIACMSWQTEVTVPCSVVRIGDGAFAGNAGLESVTLPEGLEAIGEEAFFDCAALCSINIPDSVTEIGSNAFSLCEQLADEDGFVIIRGVLYRFANGDAEHADVPFGVTGLAMYAFSDRESLRSVTIPDTVESIGECAFRCCTALTHVTLPPSVTVIENEAFASCDLLESVTVQGFYVEIGEDVFDECPMLECLQGPYGGSAEIYAPTAHIPFEAV